MNGRIIVSRGRLVVSDFFLFFFTFFVNYVAKQNWPVKPCWVFKCSDSNSGSRLQ